MEIKLRKSPAKAIRLILICTVFVMLGALLWTQLDASIWFLVFICGPFAIGYPIGLFHLLDRRPQILINEIGVYDRTSYKDFINWDVIKNAYSIDLAGLRFVVMKVDEKHLQSIRKRKFAISLTNWVDFGPEHLSISVGQIAIDEVKLAQFISAMANMTPEERKEKFKGKLLLDF